MTGAAGRLASASEPLVGGELRSPDAVLPHAFGAARQRGLTGRPNPAAVVQAVRAAAGLGVLRCARGG